MSKEGTVILDYDGIAVDLEASQESYTDHYAAKLAVEIEMNQLELRERLAAARERMVQSPRENVWMENEVRISGGEEPTILTLLAAKEVIAGLKTEKNLKIPEEDGLIALLGRVYYYSRNLMEAKFHPGFETFIDQLQGMARIVVVSGTPEEIIRRETSQLMPGCNLEIQGGVKKSWVDPDWDWQDKLRYWSLQPANYPRVADLRRPDLYRAWSQYQNISLVISDSAEMELYMAEAMGFKTALKLTGYTPDGEREYYQNSLQKGRILIDSYAMAIGVIGEII